MEQLGEIKIVGIRNHFCGRYFLGPHFVNSLLSFLEPLFECNYDYPLRAKIT